MMIRPTRSVDKTARVYPRSLLVHEWPDADRRAWEDACRPRHRLTPGGTANRLSQVSQDDFARRYGAFLRFLQRNGRLELHAGAATQVISRPMSSRISQTSRPGCARSRSITISTSFAEPPS